MAVLDNLTHIDDRKDFISDEALEIINICLLAILASAVSLFAIVFNVFIIVIFVKQGLDDTVNIRLLSLAVADLSSLTTLQILTVIRNPLLFNNVDIAVDEFQHLTAASPHNCFTSLQLGHNNVDINVDETQHLTAAIPHICFARISSWVTAYIMLERCLCVVVPLKIKTIITPRLTISVIVSIFVLVFLTLVPEYASYYMAWRFDHSRNRSILGLMFLEGREEMANVGFNFGAGTQLRPFGAVIFFTAILVVKMKQKANWRKATSTID